MMAMNEHVVNFQLHLDGTMRVLWLDGPEDDRPARIRLLSEGMKPGDVRVVRVRSYAGQMLDWEIVSTHNVEDIAPNTTTRWHGSRRDMADLVTWARQACERAQRRRASEREALTQAGWLTTHDRVKVCLTTATEGPTVSFRMSYDDGKPEPQPETEGQRLARFFATSAHEGHERRPPTWDEVRARVSWPQSKLIRAGDIEYGVYYVDHADPRAVINRDGEPWCTVWDTHITGDVDPSHPIIVEAQGALRVLAAALKQEWERG